MKFIISESAGRNQAWFDKLSRKDQKAYLEKHPKSKFGKKAAKPSSGAHKAVQPKAAKAAKVAPTKSAQKSVIVDPKKRAFKNKLDALRQKLATAKPEDIAKIRLQIKKVRDQIAASNNPKYTHTLLNGGKFDVKKNGKSVLTFTPSQHASTVKRLDESQHPGLKDHLGNMMKNGALKQQRDQEKLQKSRRR